ncbi:MAG: hypothetical protein COA79_12210 [Planctomycetota bacterium]|nr:MAG: hypothetical protein COA79_12210 [Planctomycetota bacterium]
MCSGFLVIFTTGQNQIIPAFIFITFLVHALFFNFIFRNTDNWSVLIRILLEDLTPYFITLIGCMIFIDHQFNSKNILWAMMIVFSFIYFIKGLLRISHLILKPYLSQVLIGFITLALIAGLFILPSLMEYGSAHYEEIFNRDFKDKINLLCLELNPLMIISNIFDIDPFHSGRLYEILESSYLVPKLDGGKAFKLYSFFSIISWSLFLYLKHESNSEISKDNKDLNSYGT